VKASADEFSGTHRRANPKKSVCSG
jgi:hypothetical protein